MSKPQIEEACAYALSQLRAGLDKKYVYHNVWHTEKDVMVSVERLGRLSNLSQWDIDLLRVAGAYHDIGFLVRQAGHEQLGAQNAAEALPQFGFDDGHIKTIQDLIMATKLPQSPINLMGQIMADSDLDLLGREDFFYRSEQLRKEMAILGDVVPLQIWLERQVVFLSNHTYFTQAARQTRTPRKKKHIEILKGMLIKNLTEEQYFYNYVEPTMTPGSTPPPFYADFNQQLHP